MYIELYVSQIESIHFPSVYMNHRQKSLMSHLVTLKHLNEIKKLILKGHIIMSKNFKLELNNSTKNLN